MNSLYPIMFIQLWDDSIGYEYDWEGNQTVLGGITEPHINKGIFMNPQGSL